MAVKTGRTDEDFYADTMEAEETKKKAEFLNRERGIFTKLGDQGLNTQKSVFDQGAIFYGKETAERGKYEP